MNPVVVERWNQAIFAGVQTQNRLAGVQNQDLCPRLPYTCDELSEVVIAVVLINPKPRFNRDGYPNRSHHCRHAVRHQRGFGNQAGAKAAGLHPITWATHIQIDFAESRALANCRRSGKCLRVAAPELEGHRRFRRMVTEQAGRVAMNQGGRYQHLRIQAGAFRQQSRKVAIVAVGPAHHRGHAKAPVGGVQRGTHASAPAAEDRICAVNRARR